MLSCIMYYRAIGTVCLKNIFASITPGRKNKGDNDLLYHSSYKTPCLMLSGVHLKRTTKAYTYRCNESSSAKIFCLTCEYWSTLKGNNLLSMSKLFPFPKGLVYRKAKSQSRRYSSSLILT